LDLRGELEYLKHAPLYWVDSADFGPTIGTGGRLEWKLVAHGRPFHSGFPQNAVNGIELATEAVRVIQRRFYADFPMKDEEKERYKFASGSSLKATQINTPAGSSNGIPATCTIVGDIRVTPLNTLDDVKAAVERYVKDMNTDPTSLSSVGPLHKYVVVEAKSDSKSEVTHKGRIELSWPGSPAAGLAADLDSKSYHAITHAVKTVRGKCEPFSLTGTLPLIAEMKEKGFDVQVTGFGVMSAYHAINEYAYLSHFKQGYQVVYRIIASLDATIGVEAAGDPKWAHGTGAARPAPPTPASIKISHE